MKIKIKVKSKINKNNEDSTSDDKNFVTAALAGNPNVGKSSLFNMLTGLRRHTGNWSGKTVDLASGFFVTPDSKKCELVDLPGTYSLYARSEEERVSRDFICFSHSEKKIVVVDASLLERNLIFALDVCEAKNNVIVVLNLMDEVQKSGLCIDCNRLSKMLSVPIIAASAKTGMGLDEIKSAIIDDRNVSASVHISRPTIEDATEIVRKKVDEIGKTGDLSARWLAVKFLENDAEFVSQIAFRLGYSPDELFEIDDAVCHANETLKKAGFDPDNISDYAAECTAKRAREIADAYVHKNDRKKKDLTGKLDKYVLGKYTAYPIMLALFSFILWLSAVGANYPSDLLFGFFSLVGDRLSYLMRDLPELIRAPFLDGIYLVLTWVVSVMLPPMAIFFPLFTLAEDFGILPRIAFCLDEPFRRSGSCGKQPLAMCMGLGCNCTGIMGSRIIDSDRERILSVLTNSFVPCNGRLPLLITLSSLLFFGVSAHIRGALTAIVLMGFILLTAFVTMVVCRLLSATLFRGKRSSVTIELPLYRVPNVGQVIVRSLLDRTLRVLGRSVIVAAPAGLVIWLMSNLTFLDRTPLSLLNGLLDPIGKFLGMDGMILSAFVLGMPANEIVLPIILMSYNGGGLLTQTPSLSTLGTVLSNNGWTTRTIVCTAVFCLFHFPCAPALITVFKETHSKKATIMSVVIPLSVGAIVCAALSHVFLLFEG